MHEEPNKKGKLKRLSVPILVIIAVIAVGASIFFYVKYQKSQNTAQAEQKKIVATIGERVQLPTETPTVVTVADKAKLSNKELAKRVENKDMLLIYSSSKRIIIYRPSVEKVIDMLSFGAQSESPAVQNGATTKPKP